MDILDIMVAKTLSGGVGGSSSGGGGAFYITATAGESGVVTDKTFAEALAAYQSDAVVILRIDDGSGGAYIGQLAMVNGNTAMYFYNAEAGLITFSESGLTVEGGGGDGGGGNPT